MTFGIVPIGSVVTASYYATPTHYSSGDRFDNLTDALAHTVAEFDAGERVMVGLGSTHALRSVTVDLRWALAYPEGGGIEITVERLTYDVDKARGLVFATRQRAALAGTR